MRWSQSRNIRRCFYEAVSMDRARSAKKLTVPSQRNWTRRFSFAIACESRQLGSPTRLGLWRERSFPALCTQTARPVMRRPNPASASRHSNLRLALVKERLGCRRDGGPLLRNVRTPLRCENRALTKPGCRTRSAAQTCGSSARSAERRHRIGVLSHRLRVACHAVVQMRNLQFQHLLVESRRCLTLQSRSAKRQKVEHRARASG